LIFSRFSYAFVNLKTGFISQFYSCKLSPCCSELEYYN